MSQSAERLRREPFCAMLENFLVGKNFIDERGGEYQDFPSENFYLTVPEILCGGILKCFMYRVSKQIWIKVGEVGEVVSRSIVESFLFHSARNFVS